MRKSVTACAIRAASPVMGTRPNPIIERLLEAGLLCFAPERATQVIRGFEVQFDSVLRIGRESIRVAKLHCDRANFGDGFPSVVVSLLMDESGQFYGLERSEDGPDAKTHPKVLSRLADGKQAMKWIANHFIEYGLMRSQFVDAVENPAFEFMPMVATRAQRSRRRKAKKAPAIPLAIQLEMATALVAVIQKIGADPRAETLAKAWRKIAKLHRDLYAAETTPKAANG